MEPKLSSHCGNFLPEELIMFHILPMLPVTSVLRFRCVSKQWHSFLSTPRFKAMHFHQVANGNHQTNHKLLFSCRTKPKTFSSLECEAPEHGFTRNRSLPFKTDFESICIKSSFHGLVCVGLSNLNAWHYSDLVFWNPSTGEYKTLSKGNSHKDCYHIDGKACVLYYSSFDDDYKLLRVTSDYRTYIYSLKSDSWKNIGFIKGVPRVSEAWRGGTWLNEKLYFFKEVYDVDKRRDFYSIIRFDAKTEEFTEIATPSFGNQSVGLVTLTVIRGSINLCVYYAGLKVISEEKRREIQLWRMDGDGQWTKVVTYWWKPYLTLFPSLLHVMRNGNWIWPNYAVNTGTGYIYKTDMEKNINVISCSYNAKTVCMNYVVEYIETFVSANRYIK